MTFLIEFKINPFELFQNLTLLDFESYLNRIEIKLKTKKEEEENDQNKNPFNVNSSAFKF